MKQVLFSFQLPAPVLTSYCYQEMFHLCAKLNSVTCLATDISASDCTFWWLAGVASSGTFTKSSSATSWMRDASGIPEGWTVK